MDFIMQLPESQGKTQIILVVDWFTKMADFMGLHENATAKDVTATFLREVWKLNGPTEIISDMDAKFPGELWESLCKMLGVQRRCQWPIPLTRPDICKEPTKCWKVTYEHLSITIRTTATNYCH